MGIEYPTLIEVFNVDRWEPCHPGGDVPAGPANLLTQLEPTADPNNPPFLVNADLGNAHNEDYPHAWNTNMWQWTNPDGITGPDVDPYVADAAPQGHPPTSMGQPWPNSTPSTIQASYNWLRPYWVPVEVDRQYMAHAQVAGRIRRNPGQSLTQPTTMLAQMRLLWITDNGADEDYSGVGTSDGVQISLQTTGYPWVGDPVPDRFSGFIGRMGYATPSVTGTAPFGATHVLVMTTVSVGSSTKPPIDLWFAAPYLGLADSVA